MKKRRRSRHFSFLDNEAGVSGDDSEDDADDVEGTQTLGGFVVPNETVVDESHMYARYLQSMRWNEITRNFP